MIFMIKCIIDYYDNVVLDIFYVLLFILDLLNYVNVFVICINYFYSIVFQRGDSYFIY